MKSIDKEILKLAVPNVISNISIPLLSTVDTMLMGGISTSHLAAIGAGSMIFNMIYWNFGFLRMGTTGMTAQAYGAGDKVEQSVIMCRGLLVGAILAIIIILLSGPILSVCTYLFNVEAESELLVSDYFNTRIWAAPATLSIYVLMGWLFGKQNAIYPLIITIAINVVNIFMSYYCVSVLGMEATGVALGTVIAQYFGVLLAMIFIYKKYGNILAHTTMKLVTQWGHLVKFLKINSDIFLRTVCLTFVFSFFYSQSFKLGTLVMAVNVILQQFINWMSYGIDGFAYAAESIVGKYKGAKDSSQQKLLISRTFFWGGVAALVFTVVFVLFDGPLMRLFSEDEEAISLAKDLVYFVYIFPILAFASYIWDGIYVGLLASRSMRNTMMMALGIFLITYYSLPLSTDGSHIWIAISVFIVARGVLQTIYYKLYGLELR